MGGEPGGGSGEKNPVSAQLGDDGVRILKHEGSVSLIELKKHYYIVSSFKGQENPPDRLLNLFTYAESLKKDLEHIVIKDLSH